MEKKTGSRDMIIMCRDIPVISVNFDEYKFKVLNEKFLPFTLKDRLIEEPKYTNDQKYNINSKKVRNK